VVAPYQFDAGIFRGLFNVRTIRPAPGEVFTHGTAQLVPYYFDADVALDGLPAAPAPPASWATCRSPERGAGRCRMRSAR
jgi:hypothetical protein